MAEKIERIGLNSSIILDREYGQITSQMRMFDMFLDTVTDVVVTSVSDDGKRVDCKSIAFMRKENAEDLPQTEYTEIPICSFSCSSGKMRFKVSVGDVGVLIARKYDIEMPESSDNSAKPLNTGRLVSFSQGFFIPISFCGNPAVDFELTSGTVSMTISGGVVNLIADTINLGGTGGAKVATVGKKVTNNGQPNGTVVGYIAEGSTKVNAV